MNPYNVITNRELPVLARTIHSANGGDLQETSDDLQLIDDLLTLIKNRSLLNRKYRLRKSLNKRIELELGIISKDQQLFKSRKGC